jgi:hypothetical protein
MKNNFQSSNKGKIEVIKNGPYMVSGGLPLKKEIIITDDEHCPVKWRIGEEFSQQENYACNYLEH